MRLMLGLAEQAMDPGWHSMLSTTTITALCLSEPFAVFMRPLPPFHDAREPCVQGEAVSVLASWGHGFSSTWKSLGSLIESRTSNTQTRLGRCSPYSMRIIARTACRHPLCDFIHHAGRAYSQGLAALAKCWTAMLRLFVLSGNVKGPQIAVGRLSL